MKSSALPLVCGVQRWVRRWAARQRVARVALLPAANKAVLGHDPLRPARRRGRPALPRPGRRRRLAPGLPAARAAPGRPPGSALGARRTLPGRGQGTAPCRCSSARGFGWFTDHRAFSHALGRHAVRAAQRCRVANRQRRRAASRYHPSQRYASRRESPATSAAEGGIVLAASNARSCASRQV